MDDKGDAGNAFAIPYLLTPDKTWEAKGQELRHVLDDGHYPWRVTQGLVELDLHFPTLESFDANTPELNYLTTPEFSATSSQFDLSLSHEVDDEDIWAAPNEPFQSFSEVNARNWESFHDKNYRVPRNAYVTEAGPAAFDALLGLGTVPCGISNTTKQPKERFVKQDFLLTSLLYLVLGRDSVLFRYHDSLSSFVQRGEDMRISGYSLASSQSLIHTMIDRGNKTKRLTTFIDGTYSSRGSHPTLIALANAVSSILYKLHSIILKEESQLRSVLQLQALIQEPAKILDCLFRVVQSLGEFVRDRELLFELYEFVSKEESMGGSLRSVLVDLLGQASRPWLDYLSEQLGLFRHNSGTLRSPPGNLLFGGQTPGPLSGRIESFEAFDHRVDVQSLPRFVPEDEAKIIFETIQSLQLLRKFQPDHPLSSAAPTIQPFSLEWVFSWRDMERIQDQANEYERSLMEAIEEYRAGSLGSQSLGNNFVEGAVASGFSTFGTSTAVLEAEIAASIGEFEKPILESNKSRQIPPFITETGKSTNRVNDSLLEDTAIFDPPISLTTSLSFSPIVSAQERLVNRSCLRLLLEQHHLRSHMSLLHRFSLFGDGIFASRLSHALFDPDMDTVERRKDQLRSGVSGLRLGTRKSWPPPSSELRIILAGILSEAYEGMAGAFRGLSPHGELPSGLSFAIREISETELQKCMNPNTIEALDFLRLQYKPPPPLDSIIDASSLNKYDEIFKLLLRGQRMLYVVNELLRNAANHSSRIKLIHHKAQRFRIEAHHFVTSLCCYFVDGVETAWSALTRRLDEVEEHLRDDYKTDMGGLNNLRAWHENMLDQMMFALLLRKRQTAVMQLVEEIFNLILQFARCFQTPEPSKLRDQDITTEVEDLYGKLSKRVRVFVDVCKGLVEKRGIVGPKTDPVDGRGFFGMDAVSEAGSNTIDQLLLRLDVNGYYSKPVRS